MKPKRVIHIISRQPVKWNHATRLTVGVVISLAGPFAQAADATWNTDAGGNWATATNPPWSTGAAPGSAGTTNSIDVATFGSAALTVDRTITVDTGRNIAGITFNEVTTVNAVNYILSGGSLVLTAGGVIQTVNGGSNTHVDEVNSPITLTGDATTFSFTGGSTNNSHTLLIGGAVSGSSTTTATTLNLNGVNTGGNGVGGVIGGASVANKNIAVSKSGAGTWFLNGAANTYTGGTLVSAGTLVSMNAGSMGGNGAAVTLAGGTLSLRGNANNDSTVQNINYNKALTVTGSATLDVQRNSQGGEKNIQLNSLNIGAQTLTLTNAFGYSLQVTGATTLSGNATFTQNMNSFGGGGSQPTVAQTGLVLDSLTVDNAVTTGTTTTATFNVAAISAGSINTGNVAVNGTASNNATDATKLLAITKSGAGDLTLAGGNTYSGATNLNGGNVRINAANNLGDGSATNVIGFNGGTLISTAGTYSLGANRTLTLTGAGTIQVDAGTLTVNGVIGGSGAFSKTGAATLVLSANNLNTGATAASGGTLTLDYGTNTGMKIGNAATNGAFTLAGATLNTTGTAAAPELVKGLVIGAGNSALVTGANSFDFTANGGTLTRNNNGYVTFDTTGGGSVKVAGTANTILGGYAVVGENFAARDGSGLVSAFSGYANDDFTAGNVVNVTAPAVGWAGTAIGSLKISSASTVTIAGTGSFAADGGILVGSAVGSANSLITGGTLATAANDDLIVTTNNTGTLEIASTITQTGTQGITKSGVGSLKLSGVTAITGNILINGGTLEIANPSNLTYNGVISGAGGLIKSGTSTLNLGGTSTHAGATTVNGGTLNLSGATVPGSIANSDVTVNRGASFQFSGSTTSTVTTTTARSLTLNGVTATNLGSFRKGTSQFTGDLALASGGNLLSVDALQNGGTNAGSNLTFLGALNRTSGSTVLFRGFALGDGTGHAANIRFTGTTPTLIGGAGAINTTTTSILPYATGDSGYLQGTYLVTSGLGTDFVTYNAGNTNGVRLLTNYASTISGASTNNVKITDASVAGLAGANSVNSLILNSATASAGSPGTTSVDGTGTLTVTSGALMVTTTSLATANGGTGGNYGGLFKNNAAIGASGLLTLDFGVREAVVTTVSTSTLTVGGPITGSGGLTKSGGGSLIVNGDSTLSGPTTVNAGTLLVNNTTGSGLGTSDVAVGNAATLGGTGAFAGNVTIGAGGTLSPGASIQSLASGALTLNASSTFSVELDSSASLGLQADLMTVNGGLNLNGLVDLQLADLAVIDAQFSPGKVFSLINYTGGWNGGFFTFSGNQLTQGEEFTAGLNTWAITYADTTGGDNFNGEYLTGSFVNLTAVPEPGAAFLGGIGMILLLRRRR